MSEEVQAGQVWEWSIDEEPYHIREVYLLLRRYRPNGCFAIVEGPEWEALNLETGQLELVSPMMCAGIWERLG